MVLRGKPVGEQGAADRWTALSRRGGAGPAGPRSFSLFRFLTLVSLPFGESFLSRLGVGSSRQMHWDKTL